MSKGVQVWSIYNDYGKTVQTTSTLGKEADQISFSSVKVTTDNKKKARKNDVAKDPSA